MRLVALSQIQELIQLLLQVLYSITECFMVTIAGVSITLLMQRHYLEIQLKR